MQDKTWYSILGLDAEPLSHRLFSKTNSKIKGKFQFHLSGFLEAYPKAKTKRIFKICHWPSEIIPFIRFEMQMDRT
jgi:hypothetical protein